MSKFIRPFFNTDNQKSVFIVVFCVIMLCVGTISRFHIPHPNLCVQLFELVIFRITTSAGQHFPPLLTGSCKLSSKNFSPLPSSLSGKNPDQVDTCKDNFHQLLSPVAHLNSFFYTIKPF